MCGPSLLVLVHVVFEGLELNISIFEHAGFCTDVGSEEQQHGVEFLLSFAPRPIEHQLGSGCNRPTRKTYHRVKRFYLISREVPHARCSASNAKADHDSRRANTPTKV